MSTLLGDNGLELRPQSCAPDFWYYEEGDGIHCYFDGKPVGIIKWRKLNASVKRANARTENQKRAAQK